MQTHLRRQGLETLRRSALACVLALTVPLAGAQALDLAGLMQRLGQTKSGEATFTEKRHISLLDQTLESHGTLSFTSPDVFVRETLKPRRDRIAISGNTLTLTQGDRTRTLALDSAPSAAVIVNAIRGTLTGNRDALERTFAARVSGDAKLWFLELVPREAQLRSQVISVRLAGQGGVVREVVVALPDGDRSVMSIDPMTPATKAGTRAAISTP